MRLFQKSSKRMFKGHSFYNLFIVTSAGVSSVWRPYNVSPYLTIRIQHGFSCINISQVPREVLKTEAGGRGFQHLPRDLANVNALKNHVRSLLLHKKLKTFATVCVISCTILFRLFTDVSQMQFPRTMLVLGPGSTHFVTAAILWARYEHIESYVAVHCLVNTRLSAG